MTGTRPTNETGEAVLDDENTVTAPRFPTRRQHEERWTALARAISGEATTGPATPPGELVVIGSGIEAVGFTSTDEALIDDADDVLYCVADPATQVWLKDRRPDAYDLYVLYEDGKDRYTTYVQMSEAILHLVREGRRVVAIFYGHPGIFVLSTHRAIAIARKEGHRAVMRPAVSALDMLCADLGVDPSQPGMQTFEATDMLIRRRRIDVGLHLVLWQVGLIGELGYRRQGYVNQHLPVLVEYLDESYGPDHPVVNYTAARYPGTEPYIGRHTIAELRQPDVARTLTGISTLYVPPARAVPVDPHTLERLGLLEPGQHINTPSGPLREIDTYGPREVKAVRALGTFRVPPGYQWQQDTSGARFLLALRENADLRRAYERAPERTVAESTPSDMEPRHRLLLTRRDGGAMQIAAKAVRTRPSEEGAGTLRALLNSKVLNRSLLRAVRRPVRHVEGSYPDLPRKRAQALAQWSERHGHHPDWRFLREDLDALLKQSLHPWSGLYLAPSSAHRISLYVLGRPSSPPSHRVYLNGTALKGVEYGNGRLSWEAKDGNAWGGDLAMDLTPKWARRFVGRIWNAESGKSVVLGPVEHRLPMSPPLAELAGSYRARHPEGRAVVVSVELASGGEPTMVVAVDGVPSSGEPKPTRGGFEVDGITVHLSQRIKEDDVPCFAEGSYVVRLAEGATPLAPITVQLAAGHVIVGEEPVNNPSWHGTRLSWTSGPAELPEARITVVIDPITHHPMLFGQGTAGYGAEISLVGMVPVGDEALEAILDRPRYGIPDWAWQHLVALARESSVRGGQFLWHRWEKTATNVRNLRWTLWELGL